MCKSLCLFGSVSLLLAGCSAISPAGIIATARLDPLETDPHDISLAVGVPEVLHLADGDAQLFFGFVPDGTNTPPSVDTTVPLTVSTENAPLTPLTGQTIYVVGLGASEAAQLSEVQEQIRSLKEQGVTGTGTVSVGITGGCLTDTLDDGLPVATWIQTTSGGGFTQLTRPTDFLNTRSDQERLQLIERLQPC